VYVNSDCEKMHGDYRIKHIIYCCACFIADLLKKKARKQPIDDRDTSGDKKYKTWMQPIYISSLFYSVGTWGSFPGGKAAGAWS
jgi:hypothetical protein